MGQEEHAMSLRDEVGDILDQYVLNTDTFDAKYIDSTVKPLRVDEIIALVLDDFIEEVKSALGCTDGDDIRAHLEPLIKQIKGER